MAVTSTERGGVSRSRLLPKSSWVDSLVTVSGVVLLLLLWWVGGAKTVFVPSPGEVLRAVPGFVSDPSVYVDIWVTFRRVLGALAISIFVGAWAAFAMAKGGFAGSIVSHYVSLTLGVPSTIAALLALFIFKRSEIGVYVVVAVITFPFVTVILYQGLKAVDRKLTEMASVYHFSSSMRVRHLFLPHLVPYTFAALRNEYAHAWKVVVLAELFAVNTGMGYRFAQAFDRFLLVDVMLWLFVFMIILLGTEYLILLPLEKLVTRWRSS